MERDVVVRSDSPYTSLRDLLHPVTNMELRMWDGNSGDHRAVHIELLSPRSAEFLADTHD
jgi:hypothetical protein